MCNMYNQFLVTIAIILFKNASGEKSAEVKGDVKIALLLDNCVNSSDPYRIQSLIASSVSTTDRINLLETLAPLKLGLSVHEICSESDYYKTIFDLYMQEDDYLIGIIYDKELPEKVLKFSSVLDIWTTPTTKFSHYLVKASVQFLSVIGWIDNVTVVAPDEKIMNEFYAQSKREDICITECIIFEDTCPQTMNISSPIVFFGTLNHIYQFLKNQEFQWTDDQEALFVPLDGSMPTDLPLNSYVIIPPHVTPTKAISISENILPTPILFEVAKPILAYTKNIEKFITDNCNETIYKINCLRSRFHKKYHSVFLTASGIMESLRIEPLRQSFVYNIYKVENDTMNPIMIISNNTFSQPMTKIFSYSIFDHNISSTRNFEINNMTRNTERKCVSYNAKPRYILDDSLDINFRSESWVYAFLSLSLLGVVFCISILIFLLVCIYRKDILEGNPVLTLALLLAIMILFCSVLPFSLEHNITSRIPFCLAKPLAVTLGYAFVFSLLLSRCILLATASKEIGFMSHIAGPVQSFLCLFIFGVQAALSLQVIGRCHEIFRNGSFVYLMSYNVMLLLLLLCLCPLIYKCQRNYREGKYFTIGIILTTCLWSVWLPLYTLLEDEWRDPMLCFGLVGTAGIFLGTVFIPRTYLMTIAAARDKIASTLPSMATATSTMDIYRANNHPIYDCVNVAAINAVTVARAGITATSMQHPDLYSCPALPDDEEFDFRCDTPPCTDKVTKF
ncbi:unnamed protein product [Phaedon cochleariae]|uniref:G-protein coupled receptors family 3 profile domain-containing protein n=1 Tax=Phaedon cochleariae TaxID=80249 RepID=A0A9P0GUM3_PHACE|nr:unnamed protein product [Phaedon cochleariae]